MDRNQLIGFLLIAAVFIGYFYWNMPTQEEIAEQERIRDSIELAEQQAYEAEQQALQDRANPQEQEIPEVVVDSTMTDSARLAAEQARQDALYREYGPFAGATTGEEQVYTLENDYIIAKISSKGGRLLDVRLKDYQTTDSMPVYLFDQDSATFEIDFFHDQRHLYASDFFFSAMGSSFQVSGEDSNSLALRLPTDDPNRYIEYVYGLNGDDHMLHHSIRVVGMDDLLRDNSTGFGLNWQIAALTKERNITEERRHTSVYYQYKSGEMDYLSESSDEIIQPEAKLKWISFKQQFFSASLISKDEFSPYNGEFFVEDAGGSTTYTKSMGMKFSLPIASGSTEMAYYLGPNHYQTLDDLDLGLEDQIDLGWTIFGWVNELLVIPVFNFLDEYTNWNYGIIILILTIFIKSMLFPLTYRNYKSSAKMRVLKPEIDEINAEIDKKFSNDSDSLKKQQEKQQATMSLYRKAGVNPLAGCIPMVLQMPILYAMFRFFPSSIELRQESFLWADDLSSYDYIYEWSTQIPLISDFYGNHISLFTLLMACSTFFYTRYNMQMSGGANPQFPQMKMMIYLMPVMLLVFFNQYASGLSYYYFMSNIISIGQQFVIKKWFINEEAIRRKINENKKKPQSKKKSGFAKRLEDMAKLQQQRAEQAQNQRKRSARPGRK